MPTKSSNETVYTLVDMVISICKSNSLGKGVITFGQSFYYLKRLTVKIELEIYVMLYFIYLDGCLVLNFNDEFQEFILEKYFALWKEAWEGLTNCN